MNATEMIDYDDAINRSDFASDPFRYFAVLRSKDPVHWSDYWRAWILTRYDDIKECLLNTEIFSSRGRAISQMSDLYSPEQLSRLGPLRQQFLEGLISSDPPDHKRLKGFMLKGIRPMNDENMKHTIHDLVSELLGKVERKGKMEAIRDFAYPLPIYVILEVLGVAQAERDRIKKACEVFLRFPEEPQPSFRVALSAQEGLVEIKDEFKRLLEMRSSHPRRDLISRLAEGKKAGHLSESEILTTLVTILIGGHETTTYLLGSALWIFKQYPKQLQALQDDSSLLPMATEELIRLVGPFQYVRRIVTRNINFQGKELQKGDIVMAHLGAGNRDPSVFENPDELDIYRSPNRHLGFGHGPHACLGAPFARSEVPIALKLFFEMIPHYEIDALKIEFPNASLRGPKELPLRFPIVEGR